MRRDLAPVELRIAVDQVRRRGIAELPVHSGLLEFMEQGVELAQVMRVAELANEVGGTHQRTLLVRVVSIVLPACGDRGRKAGAFDGAGDPCRIETIDGRD